MKRKLWARGMVPVVLCLMFAALPQPAARAVTDTTPPTGTIVINGDRSATNSRTVTIAMTWSDGAGSGVARMRFSDDGSTWWGVGMDSSILDASLAAVVSAANQARGRTT